MALENPRTSTSSSYFTSHPRSFADFQYVYPVVSRRAGGISLGVNLNLDKRCNFNCIYCQVDRRDLAAQKELEDRSSCASCLEGMGADSSLAKNVHQQQFTDIHRLEVELESALQMWQSGQLLQIRPFADLPPELRRLNDIALSGDGEPTLYRNFPEIVACCAVVRRRHRLADLKLVLITNASLLDQPYVQEGLAILDQNNGEIWAKLDAGTESYFRQVARTSLPLERIVRNIQQTACVRPVVIQSLFMRIAGQGPPPEELAAYCQRLKEIGESGGQIKLVQIYTIARPPAESIVSALPTQELQAIAALVRQTTGLPVAVFAA
ncbi:MAG: radical SAM protein [Thermoguttaceae bacterium]|nr:radical SAM protein [Thermoguttaceae bacterium]MDW8038972.1 radical SAM protein [Thermoguttaceae bacterium]